MKNNPNPTEKHVPMRRCVGCMESKPKEELIRFVVRDGKAVPDPESRMDGRGFYLCRAEECFGKALKRKAFQRILKRNITEEEQKALLETIRPFFQ